MRCKLIANFLSDFGEFPCRCHKGRIPAFESLIDDYNVKCKGKFLGFFIFEINVISGSVFILSAWPENDVCFRLFCTKTRE